MTYPGNQSSNTIHHVDGPRGLRGWLLLPLLDVITTPFMHGYYIYELLLQWSPLGTNVYGSDASYDSLRLPLLTIISTEILAVLIGLFCLWLMLTKSPKTPRWMIIFYLSAVLFTVIDLYGYWHFDALGLGGWSDGVRQIGLTVAQALLWVLYFRRSRRVANTFRARQAEADSKLGEVFS